MFLILATDGFWNVFYVIYRLVHNDDWAKRADQAMERVIKWEPSKFSDRLGDEEEDENQEGQYDADGDWCVCPYLDFGKVHQQFLELSICFLNSWDNY
jgi:hypothetical protein